ncbi:MAG TPA: ABC transporter permease subunit [Gemmataceae bacterium]|jgi:ABC-type transport system involved in multi-copper enzyme maturation permease subunit|nr:ABC transporter permease subunit [Gemmataceae bacterium]
MKTRFLIAGGWLRRQLAWSNTRQSWQERLGFLGLIAGGLAGWYFSQSWSPEQRIVLLAAWLLGLGLLLRRGLLKLFGPVFFFEVLRGSRRRVHLSRTIYATVLLLAISYPFLLREEFDLESRSLQGQAEMAEFLFRVFFFLQLGLIGLLTPLMVAGAISSEKESRTLEFMLATDLRSREIILGKLAGRLANMALFVLAGLPIVSILQIMGGVDPGLLFVGFAATGLTFVSLAAVSIWHSTLLKRSRDAVITTFISVAGYLVLSAMAQALRLTSFANWSIGLGGYSIDGTDVLDAIGAGNIFVHIATLEKHLFSQGSFNDVLPQLLKEYAIFHIGITVVCLLWSMARLRPVAIAQSAGGAVRRWTRRRRVHRPVGAKPMVWKEVFVEPGLRMHWVAKIVLFLLILASFWPPIQITARHWDQLLANPEGYLSAHSHQYRYSGNDVWDWYMDEMNAWVRGMTGTVGTLMLLAVGVRAAGSITGERARQTFDELLASPLENRDIIHGKWLGSVLSVRRGWIWLGLVLLVGFVSGGVNWLGISMFIGAWLIYAGFFALLGLWFSTVCRNTFRSTVATLLTSCFVLGGHWIVTALGCFLPAAAFGMREAGERELMQWLGAMQLGLTPPFVLGLAPTRDLAEWQTMRDEEIKFVAGAIIGLVAFVFAGLILWGQLIPRFARAFSRTDRRFPDRRYKSQNEEPTGRLVEKQVDAAGDYYPSREG